METNDLLMSVLKKKDPLINQVLFQSTFSAVFEHDPTISSWIPMNLEGSLYLVKGLPPIAPAGIVQRPRMSHSAYSYKLVLLNRREQSDLCEELVGDIDFQPLGQYVYVKNPSRGLTQNDTQQRAIYFSSESEARRFMDSLEAPMREIKNVY
jgi:hypothetical protein